MAPADEKPMSGYRVERLDAKYSLPDKLSAAERKKFQPTIKGFKLY